ncbi:MAG: nucleoside 2-deoxyribosyltransferase domain-containing protein [Gemmataceae bacterium]|nr:nucleoside 2-deoxyribosyltransferase domain-containing protein [Gemmataceae bacterium]
MPNLLISPPDYPTVDGPLVFLAGPIQSAPDWQAVAAGLLHAARPDLAIANPRRAYPPGTFGYAAQVDWETHHLRRAAADGVILFWLAREADHRCDRAYAQTTRFELAEWMVRHERDGVKLVIGIEDGLSGARYVRRRFGQDCPAVPLCDSLDETCRTAVQVIEAPAG